MDNELKVALAVLSLLAAQAFVLGSAFYVWLIRIGRPTRLHVDRRPATTWFEQAPAASRFEDEPVLATRVPAPAERDDDVVLPRAA